MFEPKKREERIENQKEIEKLKTDIRRTIPRELVPNGKLIAEVFGFVFIIILLISLFNIPFKDVFSGVSESVVKIGWPWSFFELKVEESEAMPFKLGNLILDLFIYLIIAYFISVVISIILSSFRMKRDGEVGKPLLNQNNLKLKGENESRNQRAR